jgi:hypothetical protein
MAEYIKRSHFFADFHAEGTLSSRIINPMLMGKPSMLGVVPVAIESSRFNNGSEQEWFLSSGPETGLFVIKGLKHIVEKIVIPGENHAKLSINDAVHAYGTFIHTNPTGYTAEDLAYGMVFDEPTNNVEYPAALLSIQNYDHHEPVLPVSIQKVNTLPMVKNPIHRP